MFQSNYSWCKTIPKSHICFHDQDFILQPNGAFGLKSIKDHIHVYFQLWSFKMMSHIKASVMQKISQSPLQACLGELDLRGKDSSLVGRLASGRVYRAQFSHAGRRLGHSYIIYLTQDVRALEALVVPNLLPCSEGCCTQIFHLNKQTEDQLAKQGS